MLTFLNIFLKKSVSKNKKKLKIEELQIFGHFLKENKKKMKELEQK